VLNLLLKPWIASCHETRDRISDYVDGELEGRNLVRVRRHLARCHLCRAMLESLTRVLDQLRSLGSGGQTVPAQVTVSAVLARIQRDER
jgi:predicted anti-sigma-YlaC factor YlaD